MQWRYARKQSEEAPGLPRENGRDDRERNGRQADKSVTQAIVHRPAVGEVRSEAALAPVWGCLPPLVVIWTEMQPFAAS